MTHEKDTGLQRALKLAGSQANLADELGCSQQYISVCFRRGYVPVERAKQIEIVYGVPRATLINPRLAADLDLDEVQA